MKEKQIIEGNKLIAEKYEPINANDIPKLWDWIYKQLYNSTPNK